MLKRILTVAMLSCLLLGIWSSTTVGAAYSARFDELKGKEFQVAFPYQPLEALPEWERTEQARDWIVHAFLEVMDVSVKDTAVMLHDQPPLRSPVLSGVCQHQYGSARWVWLDADPWDDSIGDLYAFLHSETDQRVLGSLADEFRMSTGEKPRLVHLIEYEINMEGLEASFSPRQTFAGEKLFEAERQLFGEVGFGYRESTIRTRSDLRQFLKKVDDLTYASLDDGELILGGRDLAEWTPMMDLEDAAALYEAYKVNSTCGFSLDWQGCSSLDLLYLSAALPAEIDTTAVQQEEWDSALDALDWDGDLRPLYRVADKLQAQGTRESLDLYDTISSLLGEYCCQCARYDGGLQGTEVAMTMFYCDLLAKLWGYDYRGSTPRAVGMWPVLEIPVSSIYWEEIWSHPSTRVWLGPRLDESGRSEDSLFLGPLGSRIFAASSDPSAWGQEVRATPPRALFISWWEAQWPEIMEYEQQYYRLNQIMKWTTLMAWLELRGNMDFLSFLEDEPVVREYSFPSWLMANRPELTFQGGLPFIESNFSTTECLRLLCTEIHTAYGAEEVWVEGGVSGADKKMLQEETSKIHEWLEGLYRILRTGSGDFTSPSGTLYSFKNVTKEHSTQVAQPAQGTRFRSSLSEFPATADTVLHLSISSPSRHLQRIALRMQDHDLGELSVQQEGSLVFLDFLPGLTFTAEQLTNARAEGLNWDDTIPKLAHKPDLVWQLDETRSVLRFATQWIQLIEGEVDDVSAQLSRTPSEPWIVKSGSIDKPYASAAMLTREETLVTELGLNLTDLSNVYSEWRNNRELARIMIHRDEVFLFDRLADLLRPLPLAVNEILDEWAKMHFNPATISSEEINCIAKEFLEPLLGIDSNCYRLNEETKVFQLFIDYTPTIEVNDPTKQDPDTVRKLWSMLEAILGPIVARAPSPLDTAGRSA